MDLDATIKGVNVSIQDAGHIIDSIVAVPVEDSPVMEKLWLSYQKSFSYAADISWQTVMASIRALIYDK